MSAGIAALVAHTAFWVLLAYGWAVGEVGVRGVAVFALLWVTGAFGLELVGSGSIFSSYVAVLDVVMVLLIFKGDVRLT